MAYSEDDIFLGVLPFFHIYGQVIVLLGGLVDGAKTVTMPKFDPEMFLNLIQKHRVCNFIEGIQRYICVTRLSVIAILRTYVFATSIFIINLALQKNIFCGR